MNGREPTTEGAPLASSGPGAVACTGSTSGDEAGVLEAAALYKKKLPRVRLESHVAVILVRSWHARHPSRRLENFEVSAS